MIEKIRKVLVKLAELEAAVNDVESSAYGDEDILRAIQQAKADYILSFNNLQRFHSRPGRWDDRYYDLSVPLDTHQLP